MARSGRLTLLALPLVLAAACDDHSGLPRLGTGGALLVPGIGGGPSPGTGGAGEPGTGGAFTGTGGDTGTGGVHAGTGGAGTGGSFAGTGGALVPGTGGFLAGTGGAFTGTGGMLVPGTGGFLTGSGGFLIGTGGIILPGTGGTGGTLVPGTGGTGGFLTGTGGIILPGTGGAGGFLTGAGGIILPGTGGAPLTACQGYSPLTSIIFGSNSSPTVGDFAYTYVAPGLSAPVVTPNAVTGGTQTLDVVVNAGATIDPTNAYLGFGLPFVNPPCVDARPYTGVTFTINGDLGTCALTFSVIVSEDNAVPNGPFGTCTAATCLSPLSAPITTGTTTVHFADMMYGSPLATVDVAALNGVQWSLTVPTDGVTAPCAAHFTISGVAFVTN